MTERLKEQFEQMTIEEFNSKYRLNATKEMDIEEFTDYIEGNDLSYFYASYNDEDVVNAVKDEWEVAEKLKIDYLCVEGLYIAVY